MRKLTYLAVFEPVETGYRVYFPDFPGCESFGADFVAAQHRAADALGQRIYNLEKEGRAIPLPSETVEFDSETTTGSVIAPVTIFLCFARDEGEHGKGSISPSNLN
ncbi:MAG TPA: type II toxin-antitoxin system HicB family antitoxin [Bacillota bacterium]